MQLIPAIDLPPQNPSLRLEFRPSPSAAGASALRARPCIQDFGQRWGSMRDSLLATDPVDSATTRGAPCS